VADLSSALDPIILRVRPDITWRKKRSGATVCERDVPLTPKRINQHLSGGDAVGVCPIREGESTIELALLDLDSHKGETPWEEMEKHTVRVCGRLEDLGCHPIPFRSSGGKGVHIYLIWKEPQDAYSVREFLREAIAPLGFVPGTKGVAAGTIEIFPKQDFVPVGGSGNQFILPLSGHSVPLDPLLLYAPVTREDALAIEWKFSKPVPLRQRPVIERVERRQHYSGNLETLKQALESIDPDEDYDTWLKIGMALHLESDAQQEGLDLWDEWSSEGSTYPGYEELEKKWRSFKTTKGVAVTAGFIKNLAENKGWHEDYSGDFEDVSDPNIPYEPPKEKHLRYTRIRADEFTKRPPIKWLIKKILPRGETMAYGASIAGKTFVMLDIACHIAMGMDWNGYKTTRGKVVYICAEGAGGFTSRLKAWAQHHKVSLKELGDWLTVIPETPNFLDEKDVHYLTKRIKEQGMPVDLVIVDTLAQVTAGADENSGKDMGLALRLTKMLANTLKCAYCLVHHTGKDETRGARGWSGMKGQLDALLYIYREEHRRVFWVDKMKDDRDNFGFDFSLKLEVVGTDEDGDPIESCYVSYTGDTAVKKQTQKKRGTWEDLVMKAIDTLEMSGMATTIETVLEEVKISTPHDKSKKDRRREYCVRALQSLVKDNVITINGESITNEYNKD
jgi:hypothetical protein